MCGSMSPPQSIVGKIRSASFERKGVRMNVLPAFMRTAEFDVDSPVNIRANSPNSVCASSPLRTPVSHDSPVRGVIGKVVRSVSFERKRSKSEASKAQKTPAPNSAKDCESPPSSSCGSPAALPSNGLAPLHGHLDKRKGKAKTLTSQWSQRYFVVDDKVGTLRYQKNAWSSKATYEAKVILPIADIASVTEISGDAVDNLPHCFRVSCPPIHMTLRADDREDCMLWIRGLRQRMVLRQGLAAGGNADQQQPGRSGEAAEAARRPLVPHDWKLPESSASSLVQCGSTGERCNAPAASSFKQAWASSGHLNDGCQRTEERLGKARDMTTEVLSDDDNY